MVRSKDCSLWLPHCTIRLLHEDVSVMLHSFGNLDLGSTDTFPVGNRSLESRKLIS